MTLVLSYLDAAVTLVRRDFLVFLSYRLRFLGQIASTFFSVILFYYISRLVHVGAFVSPDDYFAFVVVGLAIMGTLISSLSALPMRVRQELVAGTFERVLLSPFGPVAAVCAAVVFPLVLSLVEGVLTVAFAAVVFGMPIKASAALAVPTALIAAFSFVPSALFAASAVIVAKQAQSGVGFAVTGISLISGVFFPVALLPSWIQWTTHVQPFTPTLALLRHLIAGTPMIGTAGVALLKLFVFIAVLTPVALLLLRSAIRVGQRRGTIIEY
jgi:ABC-2 type transport system permease protein